MITVSEIAFTGYPVTDMDRARGFYEKVLNLKPSSTFEHEGKHWIEYDIGPGTLAITNMNPGWVPSKDGGAIALEVADFDAAMSTLRENNVAFLNEPADTPVCHLAIITDPDGNALAIHKRKNG